MSDSTTEGYAVTDVEIDGMVRNLCAYALGEPDPLQRYADLTHQQVLFDGIVAAIRKQRGRALADLMVAGMPVADVVAKTNLTTAVQVRKLLGLAGEAERVKAATAKPSARRSRAAAPPVEAPQDEAPLAITVAPEADPVLPQITATSDKRVLTAMERRALGLPADGSLPRPAPAEPPAPAPAAPRVRRRLARTKPSGGG